MTYTTSDRAQLYWFLRQFRLRAIQDQKQQTNRVGLYFAQKRVDFLNLHLTMLGFVLQQLLVLERENEAA